ncbi:MAG: hypothetical protein AB8H80_16960 [Planctomycetota bacterium]
MSSNVRLCHRHAQPLLAFCCALLACAAALVGQGKQFLTPKAALALAFPDCKVERTRHVLSDAHKLRVKKLGGGEVRRSMVYAYEARKGGKLVGTAWFDRHKVRSKQELLMVVVDPRGKVRRIEMVAFEEPLDYIPRDAFYEQFLGRPLSADLSVKRAITPVAGATLTVRATLQAVRRVLATHQVIYPKQAARPKGPAPSKKASNSPAAAFRGARQ